MADSQFKTQVSKDENANAVTNELWVALTDGTNAVTVTGGKLDVNASVTLETAYVDDSAFVIGTDKVNAQGYLADETAPDSVDEGDIGIARMTLDRKVLTVITDGSTDANRLAIDASGYVTSNINGTVTVSATNLDIRDLTHVSDSVQVGDGTNIMAVDASGYITVNVNGTVTVDATDLDIRNLAATQDNVAISDGTDSLSINSDGSINVVFGVASSGSEVHDYKTATPAAAAVDNHDYTVSNTTFLLKKVTWSGSGKIKCEVSVGALASLATKYVGFTEKEKPGEIEFNPAIPVPVTGTGTVRVALTNRSGAGVDVYSTIMGEDI